MKHLYKNFIEVICVLLVVLGFLGGGIHIWYNSYLQELSFSEYLINDTDSQYVYATSDSKSHDFVINNFIPYFAQDVTTDYHDFNDDGHDDVMVQYNVSQKFSSQSDENVREKFIEFYLYNSVDDKYYKDAFDHIVTYSFEADRLIADVMDFNKDNKEEVLIKKLHPDHFGVEDFYVLGFEHGGMIKLPIDEFEVTNDHDRVKNIVDVNDDKLRLISLTYLDGDAICCPQGDQSITEWKFNGKRFIKVGGLKAEGGSYSQKFLQFNENTWNDYNKLSGIKFMYPDSMQVVDEDKNYVKIIDEDQVYSIESEIRKYSDEVTDIEMFVKDVLDRPFGLSDDKPLTIMIDNKLAYDYSYQTSSIWYRSILIPFKSNIFVFTLSYSNDKQKESVQALFEKILSSVELNIKPN